MQGIHTHIIATSYSDQWHDWENTTNKIAAKKGVVSAIPRMKRYGLVQSYQDIEPVIIYELSAKYWPKWLRGDIHSDEQALQGGDIVPAWVQKDLADRLYLQPGDTFSAITPEQRDGELSPRGLRFKTESIFNIPCRIHNYEYDYYNQKESPYRLSLGAFHLFVHSISFYLSNH